MTTTNCFSRSYAEARTRFLAAAATHGLEVTSYQHPLPGRDGEELALDVVVDGLSSADRMLIVSSACHGVEGFCGSAVQLALLENETWRKELRQAGVALLYLHGVNPYGFSWLRRTTHENVDLNRNFVDFAAPLPANDGYAELAQRLVPEAWPPGWISQLQLLARLALMGSRKAQIAVSAGQYAHPDGIFYGGNRPTWSQTTVRQILREYASDRARLAWIDLHSGLGPTGVGERIFAARYTPEALARARAWWGPGVTSSQDHTTSSMVTGGQMWTAIYDECPHAEYTGLTLEFGTVPLLRVLHALRGEQWLANTPNVPQVLRKKIQRDILNAFYVDTPEWQQSVLEQAEQVMWEALRGLI